MSRIFKSFCLILLLAILAAGLLAGRFMLTPVTPPPATVFSVRHGEPFVSIARRLETAGIVADARALRLLARWRDAAGRIQAGTYAFSAPATPQVVLDRLVKGDVLHTLVTIPEGWTQREIAARLEEKGLAKRSEILQLAGDPDFLHELQIPATSLEGYLFPETYSIASGASPRQILTMMVEEFRQRLTPDMVRSAKEEGFTVHQLVTLASIVQKETGNAKEMPLIAAVFRNRLRRHMPLQSDPTVIYGIADFNGNLTRADLERKTPYNTYRIAGLPPGPIASPGSAALEAVAHPADVAYLYFVARGDGSHAFSATLAEHNRAVRRYQLHR